MKVETLSLKTARLLL